MLSSALSSTPKRPFLLAALFAFPLALLSCTAEQGTTPTCEPDVTEAGNLRIETGCNPFAVCVRINPDTNQPERIDPEGTCCANKDGCELAECLYGFGIDPYPEGGQDRPQADLVLQCGKGGGTGGGGGQSGGS